MVKVLYYNWTDYRSTRGGGVTVYLKNLLAELNNNEEIEPVFLSSGDVYSPFSNHPYIRPVTSLSQNDCPSFELVNSPVPAPASQLANNLHNYLAIQDTRILDILRNFIIDQGGFEVIHFHNLEGLPLNVLQLKEYFPHTKIFFSLHNYFPFCPQVQLFQHHHGQSCCGNRHGQECTECRNKELKSDWFEMRLASWFAPGSIWPRVLKLWLKIKSVYLAHKLLAVSSTQNTAAVYEQFCRLNISYINRYIDKVLTVSHRVYEIAATQGISSNLLEVAYIGTDYAKTKPSLVSLSKHSGKNFTMAYLGYARKAKGFDFFLSALEQLPDETAAIIHLKIAARYLDEALDPSRLQQMQRRFHKVEIFDGYRREELPHLLSDVDLGIVPVIWEDNLPQVAIEMAAHGVPVLASDYGGASELSASPYFRFKGNNIKDFNSHLLYIISHREVLAEYHHLQLPLITMQQHIDYLKKLYHPAELELLPVAG